MVDKLETHSARSYARTTLNNFQDTRAPISRIPFKHRLTPIKFCSQLWVLRV